MSPTLLLHLPENECHVSSAPICAKTTLPLQGVFLGKRRSEPVKQDTGQNLTGNGELCNTPIVRTIRRDTFALVQGYEDRVPLRSCGTIPCFYHAANRLSSRTRTMSPPFWKISAGIPSLSGDFPDSILAKAISISVVLGCTSRSSHLFLRNQIY